MDPGHGADQLVAAAARFTEMSTTPSSTTGSMSWTLYPVADAAAQRGRIVYLQSAHEAAEVSMCVALEAVGT